MTVITVGTIITIITIGITTPIGMGIIAFTDHGLTLGTDQDLTIGIAIDGDIHTTTTDGEVIIMTMDGVTPATMLPDTTIMVG